MGLAALGASLELILQLGVAAIAGHVQGYHDQLEPELVSRGFTSVRAGSKQEQSGSLCVDTPAGTNAIDVHAVLTRRGIAVSRPDGHLRFSPHWPNSLAEIPAVLAAIDAAL